ncbi:YybH family protein [Pedobacter sp.]|uniref:YybH family protein n=1 Tax=Pedobacter sp. TaxID=1411316 RepID=UPI003D7F8C9D
MIFEQDVALIKAARLASNKAILEKNVSGVSKFWLSDFLQVAGDGSHTLGKAKVIAEWKYMFTHSSPVFERLPSNIQINASGDKAWEQGVWTYHNEPFYGNYSAMWHKVKGQWLTKCELYVSLN